MTDSSKWTLFWALLGLGLLAAEMMTLTFFFLFFGVAGLLVAGLRLLGVESLVVNVFAFTAFGSMGLLFFRKRMREALAKNEGKFEVDQDAVIRLDETVPAHGEGRVQYQGTTWSVVNMEDSEMPAGTQVRIARVQGIKLHVRRDS
jgi:membrane protein implicated in regulation of membrane protease activity